MNKYNIEMPKLDIVINTIDESLQQYFPAKIPKVFNTATAKTIIKENQYISNGIRRALIDECPTVAFAGGMPVVAQFDESYAMAEYIKKEIYRIPLYQTFCIENWETIKDFKFELRVGPYDTARDIYIADLTLVKGKMTPAMIIFNPGFILFTLMPGKRVTIVDIGFAMGLGRNDAIYQLASCPVISPLGLTPDDDINGSGFKELSTEIIPKEYSLKFHVKVCREPADVEYVFKYCIKNLIKRFNNILSALSEEDANIKIDITQINEDIYQSTLFIPQETYTITGILQYTIYELHKEKIHSIKFNENTLTILSLEKNVTEIIKSAIMKILTRLNAILS